MASTRSGLGWALLFTATALLGAVPVRPACAEDAPAAASAETAQREKALAEIREHLAEPAAAERLRDAGLTAEDVIHRAEQMTTAELRYLVERMRAEEKAGGDVLGVILVLAVIALIVVLIFVLLDKKVEVKDRGAHAPSGARGSGGPVAVAAVLG